MTDNINNKDNGDQCTMKMVVQPCEPQDRIYFGDDNLQLGQQMNGIKSVDLAESDKNDQCVQVNADPTLALMVKNSIEFVTQVPPGLRMTVSEQENPNAYFNFLSDDAGQAKTLQNDSVDQVRKNQIDKDHLASQLGLQSMMRRDQSRFALHQNTKNVLRNIGNAQNQYCLYHEQARAYIAKQLSHPSKFDSWLRGLRLENFGHFRFAWHNAPQRAYVRVYRKLCYDFYISFAIPYLASSRIRNMETRKVHMKYLYRFLEGLQDPESFTCFKNFVYY